MISTDVIEEVRRLVDAVALIGARVQLRKSGSSFVGCCPFHEEREGSFRVYPEEKRFVCYGCGARGDIFEFFQRLDGKAFPTVVRDLAPGVRVVIPSDSRGTVDEQRARKERLALLAACEAAASHWEQRLWGPEGAAAREYLASRGIREDVARAFRLGYALPEWHDLHGTLQAARVPAAVQHAAGVLAAKDDPAKGPRYYDRFRERVMFPVLDGGGRALGFAGRAIGGERGAKYLNTPETDLYKKARTLYGLHLARDVIRRTGKAVLVEGYFDVISLHQVGIAATVGLSGTALSEHQVKLVLAAGCRELVLLFDGDDAGARAPGRAAPALFQAGLTTTVVRLPPAPDGNSDPHAVAQRLGAAGLEQLLEGAVPLTEYLIDEAIRRHVAGPGPQACVEHKLRAVRELTPFVLAAPAGLARSTFEKTLARRLDLDIGPLRVEVQRSERRIAAPLTP
jgi:DNA primase